MNYIELTNQEMASSSRRSDYSCYCHGSLLSLLWQLLSIVYLSLIRVARQFPGGWKFTWN